MIGLLTTPVIIWMALAGYGLAVGIPTAVQHARRRKAFRYFGAHPAEAEAAGLGAVDEHGIRADVSRALLWGELTRIAAQALFLLIGFGAIFPGLFGTHFGEVFQDSFIAVSALLDLQTSISRRMATKARLAADGKAHRFRRHRR